MKLNLLFRIFVLLTGISIFVFLVSHCAHPVAPTGGPKDETPPQVKESKPENYSIFFSDQQIVISFDEFIDLKNPMGEIFFSPPLETNAKYKTKGKSLHIVFQEELKENTTYTIYFGNAIIDITEQNPKTNYEFVFSTGPEIDSLSVRGEVLNGFDLKAEKEVLVLLYTDNNDTVPLDSLPLLVRPVSATRTDKEGHFQLNNLKDEPFKIFALADANNNYRYDLPNERIAFIDSLIYPEYMGPVLQDTALRDTVDAEAQIEFPEKFALPENYYSMLMFDEFDSIQRLTFSDLIKKDEIIFTFKYPAQNIIISPVDTVLTPGWKLEEYGFLRDSLTYYLRFPVLDTLILEVKCDTVVLDTVSFMYRERQVSRRDKKKIQKKETLKISNNTKSRKAVPNTKLKLSFSRPVERYYPEKIMLLEGNDTLLPALIFTDSIQRHAVIDHTLQGSESYQLIIPDTTFTDIRGVSNDTNIVSFKTNAENDYGTFNLNVDFSVSQGQYIIQILDSREKILRKKIIKTPGLFTFHYLLPGKYLIKAIHDRNGNGKWDTGDYLQHLQPEQVFYYKKEIDVRANWDIQEEWFIP